MPKKVSRADLNSAFESVTKHGVVEASRILGMAKSTLQGRFEAAKKMKEWDAKFASEMTNALGGKSDCKSDCKQEFTHECNGDVESIRSVSKTIRTLDQALEEAKVDRNLYDISRHKINKWDSNAGNGAVIELWQVTVELTKKKFNSPEVVVDKLIEKMKDYAPKKFEIIKRKPSKNKMLGEISLCDMHFGKLADSTETGETYNLEIADRLYRTAAADLVERMSARNLDKLLFIMGNDILHVDSSENTTSKGTRQDIAAMWHRSYETAYAATIDIINDMRKVAPVDVINIQGNHDSHLGFTLGHAVGAYFNNCKDVTVDHTRKSRKYYRWGMNLLGFCHGDGAKHRALPLLMAEERPKDWAETTQRIWHIGHLHKRMKLGEFTGDSYNSVEISVLPSLSGTDSWHDANGYKGNKHSESYVWDSDSGLDSMYSYNPPKDIYR